MTNRGEGSPGPFIRSVILDGLKLDNSIPVGNNPRDIIFDPMGRFAWVANAEDNNLAFIDSLRDKQFNIDTLNAQLEIGNAPEALAITPEGYRLFVATYSKSISVIDLNRREEFKTIWFNV